MEAMTLLCSPTITCLRAAPHARQDKAHLRPLLPGKPLRLAGTCRPARLSVIIRANQDGQNSGQGQDAPFSLMSLPTWAQWLLGSVAWLIIPLYRRLQKFGDTVEKVDEVVERIEEYAAKADKIAEELAEELPDGSLKRIVQKVEKASEEVLKKASMIDDVLDKVTEIVDELEEEKDKSSESTKAKSK